MTDRKPLRWSSPGNAWAIGALALSFAIPVLSVTEVYQPVALEAISVILADAWQWVLLVTVMIALASALSMPLALDNGSRMQALVMVEGVATIIVSACYVLLWISLVRQYGFAANPLTQVLVLGLGLTALGRVGQITWQSWRYRRALRSGYTTHTEAIAQPKET